MLRRSADPLVVDLGYGATPVTTLEWHDRLVRHVRDDVDVIGIEIDAERVVAAKPLERPGVRFIRGGFEIPTADRRPAIIRAFNVLRQYAEEEVEGYRRAVVARLAPGGALIEGTCDEIGRRAAWVTSYAGDDSPRTFTMSVHLATLDRPSDLAERLPKSLIHRNVPGERVHAYLTALDRAWEVSAAHATFGPRQRWVAAMGVAEESGVPLLDGPMRWRLGEVTVPWAVVRP